ncbi:MAG: 3-hydroxybutyryl-CoA dehydrogenase [Saprospiraceae bacterium]|nr:3-hydroxybutyryl-CoA dehydrogenase [Saprospiraceae bacterium]HRG40495.1 3-hydroxyacyl-CoA dehydrogenase NAD-binding domain-containing protein [Saprospiraceae bacterium]
MVIGIVGAGAMGAGIAQVAAMAGNEVRLFDTSSEAKNNALLKITESINKFVAKGQVSPEEGVAITGRIYLCEKLETFADCDMVIEAIIEDLSIKKTLFINLESVVSTDCILATNTSSLSVTSIASSLNRPERCIGVHFFNPPVLMKLVEVVPAIQTNRDITNQVKKMIESWGKTVVLAKDTPGFIVNKVARPFYSEAIRILEEGIAEVVTIDQAMTENGFKMGPFTLMDFIGHDVNYRVTESVWKSFFYDSRYRPSFTQLRLLEAGYLGKKSGKGFYDYTIENTIKQVEDASLKNSIFLRIISMLINEAADTVWQQICSKDDVELAMKLGVNYPKGLLEWGSELGYQKIVDHLDDLHQTYGEERYRVCRYLRNLA